MIIDSDSGVALIRFNDGTSDAKSVDAGEGDRYAAGSSGVMLTAISFARPSVARLRLCAGQVHQKSLRFSA